MVNERFRLPVAVHGKPAATADAGGYRFLVRHPAFDPPPLDRALRRMVGALEWKAAPHRHAPVFGLLAAGECTLVARFLDVGRDAHARPHSLRVECVLCDRTCPPGAMLRERAWTDLSENPGDVAEVCLSRAFGGAPPAAPGMILLVGDATAFSPATSTRILASAAIPRCDRS